MSGDRQNVKEAVDMVVSKLDRGVTIPSDPEMAKLLGNLLNKHREMGIGPNGWPQGWLGVDQATLDFARKFNELTEE